MHPARRGGPGIHRPVSSPFAPANESGHPDTPSQHGDGKKNFLLYPFLADYFDLHAAGFAQRMRFAR
jgi:hypothetical protein